MSETIDTLFDLSVLLQMSENLMGAGLHPAPVVFLGGASCRGGRDQYAISAKTNMVSLLNFKVTHHSATMRPVVRSSKCASPMT